MTLILQDETFDMKNYGQTNLKQKEKLSDKRYLCIFLVQFYKYFIILYTYLQDKVSNRNFVII